MRDGPLVSLGKMAAVLFILLWSGAPIAMIVLSSFKPTAEIFRFPPSILFEPTLQHYRTLVEKWPDFFSTLINSAAIALFATILTVASALLAGYVYSRYRGRSVAASALFMVAIRLLPPIVIILPLFPATSLLGLNDTWLILVLLYATFFVSIGSMVLKTYIDSIPRELDEAAVIDGAGELQVLWRLIVPLAAPGMVAAAIFVFVYSWNEYLFAFVFTTSESKTAPIVISEMMGSLTGVDWGLIFAAASVQLVPVTLFVVSLQRFLMAGLTAGSVKG
jgi:multiple sugar transport system permease protein